MFTNAKGHCGCVVIYSVRIKAGPDAWGKGVRIDTDSVGTGGQVVKEIGAVGISGCGGVIVRCTIAVKVDADTDLDTGERSLSGIKYTVAVSVIPHLVTDGARAGIAEILVQIDFASCQAQVGGVIQSGIRVTGGLHAVRQGGRINGDVIFTGRQIGEQIGSVRAGGDGHGVIGLSVIVKITGYGDSDSRDSGLTRVLDAVIIGVIPDGITDGAGAFIAEIHIQVGLIVANGYLGGVG